MKANIFTAADYVDTSAGRLTIVGAFDNIESDKCPFSFRPFGIAIKLISELRDLGKTYEGHLFLRKAGTKKPIVKIQMSMNFEKGSQKKINALIIALNMVGAKFDSFGTYILELKTGPRIISSTKIKVVRKPKPVKTKKAKRSKTKTKA